MPWKFKKFMKVGSFNICGEISKNPGSSLRLGPNMFFTLSGSWMHLESKNVRTPGAKRICGGRSSIRIVELATGYYRYLNKTFNLDPPLSPRFTD